MKRQRAPRGQGSITPYGDGKFKGIITIGYKLDPVTKKKNKRLTKTFTGKTRKEVQAKITEYQYKVNAGKINPLAAPLTFKQYSERWLMMKKTTLKPQTYRNYESNMQCLDFGNKVMKDITVSDVNTLLLTLLQTLSPATVRLRHALLKSIFEGARKEKLIIENPVEDSMRIKAQVDHTVTEMHVLTKEESTNVLLKAKEMKAPIWFYPLIRTALETGMRKGELRALQYKALGKDTIYIKASVEDSAGKGATLTTPKTRASVRRIHVSTSLIEILQALPHKDENSFVFHTKNETLIANSDIQYYFNALKKKSNIDKPLHFHDLRHTHATLLIMAGVNIKTVSTRLGHASVSITLNRYTHALPQQDKEASEMICGMLLSDTTMKDNQ